MKSSIAVLLAVLIGVSCGTPAGKFNIKRPIKNLLTNLQPYVEYGNANLIVDGILFNVNRQLPDLFPIGDLGGPYDLTNCFFRYEHGIKRDGDATMLVDGIDVKFNCPFKMETVSVECTWHEMGLEGDAKGMTDKVSITSGMYVRMQSGQHPWLTEFRSNEIAPITTDISGAGLVDGLAEAIANTVILGMADEIDLIIETVIKDAFQDVLNTMIIP